MNVTITLDSMNVSVSGRVEVHLAFPNESTPYHSSQLLKKNNKYPFILHKNGCVFLILHIYNGEHLKKRILFQPYFNTQNNISFSTFQISYLIYLQMSEHGNQKLIENDFFMKCDIYNTFNKMELYNNKNTSLIGRLTPADGDLTYKHSVSYDLLIDNMTVKIPYASLATRSHLTLQNVKLKTIEKYQFFFRRVFVSWLQEHAWEPAKWRKKSKAAYFEGNKILKHSVMLDISNFFSYLLHSNIHYLSDKKATGNNDYVGLNVLQNQLVADCEDIASAGYDTMRVFRRLFPAKMADLEIAHLDICSHMSAWLNNSKIMLCQGSALPNINQKAINHIWCSLLLNETCKMVIVEGTREQANNHQYKYLIKSWWMQDGIVHDCMMINPNNHTYGLPMQNLTDEWNAKDVFESWSHEVHTTTEENQTIIFGGSIQTEAFTFLEKVT